MVFVYIPNSVSHLSCSFTSDPPRVSIIFSSKSELILMNPSSPALVTIFFVICENRICKNVNIFHTLCMCRIRLSSENIIWWHRTFRSANAANLTWQAPATCKSALWDFASCQLSFGFLKNTPKSECGCDKYAALLFQRTVKLGISCSPSYVLLGLFRKGRIVSWMINCYQYHPFL